MICLPTICRAIAVADHIYDADAMVYIRECCVADVADWCAANRLQLNADKTELLWFGSISLLRRLSSNSKAFTVGRNVIKPTSCVRNLGVLFDSELSMREHVSRVTQICFFHLRRL